MYYYSITSINRTDISFYLNNINSHKRILINNKKQLDVLNNYLKIDKIYLNNIIYSSKIEVEKSLLFI